MGGLSRAGPPAGQWPEIRLLASLNNRKSRALFIGGKKLGMADEWLEAGGDIWPGWLSVVGGGSGTEGKNRKNRLPMTTSSR